MKTLYITSVLLAMTCLISCGSDDKTSEQNSPATFKCPMECEGEKVYSQAGICPVCEMDLTQE